MPARLPAWLIRLAQPSLRSVLLSASAGMTHERDAGAALTVNHGGTMAQVATPRLNDALGGLARNRPS
jgi:hypothetical protein